MTPTVANKNGEAKIIDSHNFPFSKKIAAAIVTVHPGGIPRLIDTPLTRHEERYAQAVQVAGKTSTGDLKKDEEEAKKELQAKSPLGVP